MAASVHAVPTLVVVVPEALAVQVREREPDYSGTLILTSCSTRSRCGSVQPALPILARELAHGMARILDRLAINLQMTSPGCRPL